MTGQSAKPGEPVWTGRDIFAPFEAAPIFVEPRKIAPGQRAFRAKYDIVPDDGSDGLLWVEGERYVRENGRLIRLLDVIPQLEAETMVDSTWDANEEKARRKSLGVVGR